jgi:hypothetical protein
MAKQTTPHNQTEQNVNRQASDLEPDQLEQTSETDNNSDIYRDMDGAETAGDRASRKTQGGSKNQNTEDAPAAFEGSLVTRTPKGAGQGITSRAQDEERGRQEKVVKDRPDANAGVNHGKR